MNWLKKPVPSICLLLTLSTVILFSFWKKMLLAPHAYLFGASGDAIKNYYTSLYYVKYGKGLHFNGMWYPFGEHVLYTDNIPILSLILNKIHHHIYPIGDATIGIINLLMLLSIIVAILFIYLILKHYKTSTFFAICMAIIIGFLAPQMNRLTGHYSLAFMNFIPMLWYFLIRLYNSKKPFTWSFALFFLMVLFGFIHSYYLLIGGSFLLAYVFVQLVSNSNFYNKKKPIAAFLSAISSVIFFLIFMSLTDNTSDRHSNPHGILNYTAHYLNIFFPPYDPMKSVVNSVIPYTKKSSEGWAYIGLVATSFALFLLLRKIKFLFKRNWQKAFSFQLPKSLGISLWAALLVLAFSLGFPLTTFPDLLEILPSGFKQFRTLGRFAMVFYYVMSVVAAFTLFKIYRLLRQKNLTNLAFSVVIFVGGLWALEANIHTKIKVKTVKNNLKPAVFLGLGKEQNYVKAITEKGYKPGQFQAILPLPYFNIGSEELYVEREGKEIFQTCKASYTLGLPIATGYLSRTSLSNSYALAQLLSSKYIDKEVLSLFNDQPILLLTNGDKFTEVEKQLIAKGKYIDILGSKRLYELPISAFNSVKDSLLIAFENQKDSLLKKQLINGNTFYSETENMPIVYDSFEQEKPKNYELINGGFSGDKAAYQKNGELLLHYGKLPNAEKNQLFTASVWTKIDDRKAAFTPFIFQQINKEGNTVEEKRVYPKESTEIYNGWVKVSHDFQLLATENIIKLSFKGKYTTADDLLIQPLNSAIFYSSSDNNLMFNNYVIQEN